MSSIKDEPTERGCPLRKTLPASILPPVDSSTVKCEWSLKGGCACDDGKCEDCQATEEEDEKDNILTMTPAATSLNNQETDETEFHPPIWEDCKAEETGCASDEASEDVKPVLKTIDGNLADGPIIEQVEIKKEITDNVEGNIEASQMAVTVPCNEVEIKEESEMDESPIIEQVNPDEIKEEIPDKIEEGNACDEAEMQVEASPMSVPVVSDNPLVSSRESPGLKNVPVIEEIIIKSESDEATFSSQLPINCQMSPPEAESNDQSTTNHKNGNVCKAAEMKEEAEEDEASGPMIEEVNPHEEMMEDMTENVAKEGSACEEDEMQIEETSQGIDHVDSDSRPSTREGEGTLTGLAVDEMMAESENDLNSNDQPSIIQQANPEQRNGEIIFQPANQVVISNCEGSKSANTELEPNQEVVGQAETTALSSLSLRRSTRVRKRPVKFAVLPEAEEEMSQDEPETDTSDSDESEADSEMERDAQSETEETSHHQIKPIRPYVCPLPDCGKAFEYESHLDRHTINHSDLKPFSCSLCGVAFKRKGTLIFHQQTMHTNARPHVCTVCLKAFKRKGDLVQHTLTHSGIKTFACPDWGGAFARKFDLERHRQRKSACASRYAPSESRPFVCTVEGCGKTFKDKYTLKMHARTHSGVKEFKCTVCERPFTLQSNLYKHKRQFHGS